jgi:hypothetical protein
MESRVYKIRPFGSAEKGRANVAKEKAGLAPADEDRLGVNMRDLGPAGVWRLRCRPGVLKRRQISTSLLLSRAWSSVPRP